MLKLHLKCLPKLQLKCLNCTYNANVQCLKHHLLLKDNKCWPLKCKKQHFKCQNILRFESQRELVTFLKIMLRLYWLNVFELNVIDLTLYFAGANQLNWASVLITKPAIWVLQQKGSLLRRDNNLRNLNSSKILS